MNTYRLAIDGDSTEKESWFLFLQREFPEYEIFWQKYIVPLTNRPHNIHFKNDTELAQLGKGPQDICIAQLHYTILVHLRRAFLMLSLGDRMSGDEFKEGIIRLSSVLDVADELLERFNNRSNYDPWLESGDKQHKGGREAREAWRRKPFSANTKPLRDYRNHLVHGRLSPSVNGQYPVIGQESQYFDWRKVTDPGNFGSLNPVDFAHPHDIVKQAWDMTLSYLRDMWRTHLLRP